MRKYTGMGAEISFSLPFIMLYVVQMRAVLSPLTTLSFEGW